MHGLAPGMAALCAAASGALLAACGSGAARPAGPNPLPSIDAFVPTAPVAGGPAMTLRVRGHRFVTGAAVQWNGSSRPTTYMSPDELAVSITATDLAVPAANTLTVVNPPPGGGVSAGVVVTPLWPKPERGDAGLLVDAATDLGSPNALEGFGGPLFAAWNPTAADAAGPGMKIMMFGVPAPPCPASTQGPMASFGDATLDSDGYVGNTALVPASMRFMPMPMSACAAAAGALAGPNNVFFDGTTAWSYTASLGHPDDLLLPFTTSGSNALGVNSPIINTSVNYQVDRAHTSITPWAVDGRARIGVSARVTRIQAENAAVLTQTKQLIGATFLNTACVESVPGALCQLYVQFAEAIAESDMTDWSQSDPAQHIDMFLDPNEANLPVIAADLIPGAGQTVADPSSGLALFTSRGAPTGHSSFDVTQFDVEIDFDQFENVVRLMSALTLDADVATDAGCAQCVQVFGSRWSDPQAWVLASASSQQEIYDQSGNSGSILGGHDWLYVGAAP